jgi:hypothetical protein
VSEIKIALLGWFYETVDTVTRQLADKADFEQYKLPPLLNFEKYGQQANMFPNLAFILLKKSHG